MKRSKTTLYRNVKRGTTTCLHLSQDYLIDSDNSSIYSFNNNISIPNTFTGNTEEEFQCSNSTIHFSNDSDSFENLYDPRSQFNDNFDNIAECDTSIHLRQNVEDNIDKKDTENNFINKLRSWAISYNVPHNALRDLLKLLKSETNICVPQDPRTLLCTPRHTVSKSVAPGTYSHIGIQLAVEKLIHLVDKQPEKINLLVNIDGLPLSKSSSSQIYPILCSIYEYPQHVSVIGIYHGYEKPGNVNDFLEDFTVEATKLSEEGFIYKNRTIPFAIKGFICDAPAKSLITYCKGHTG